MQKSRSHDGGKSRASCKSTRGDMRPLGPTFAPGPTDVICARGGDAYAHPGNHRLRALIEMNAKRYSEARSKKDKSNVVSAIISAIREATPPGHFIKKECGEWNEVGDGAAREKVGQNLRDVLHTMYRSSSKAKHHRSKAKQAMKSSAQINSNNPPLLHSSFQETDHQIFQERNEENLVKLVNLKKAAPSVAEIQGIVCRKKSSCPLICPSTKVFHPFLFLPILEQVSDTLSTETRIYNSAETFDYSELLSVFSNDDTSNEAHRCQNTEETTMQSDAKTCEPLSSNLDADQFSSSNILRSPLVDDALSLDTNRCVAAASMGPAVMPALHSSANSPFADSAQEIRWDPTEGISPVGESFDDIFCERSGKETNEMQEN